MVDYLDDEEFNRWLSNAKSTLRSAEIDSSSGYNNWACFKAQQAAEYAIKAYLRGIGSESYGQSVSLLLKKANFDEGTVNLAKSVDKYYIPQDTQMHGPKESLKIISPLMMRGVLSIAQNL